MNWYSLLPLLILCSAFFKMGMPAIVIYFRFDFLYSFLFAVGSGFTGSIFYTYFSYYLIQLWKKIKQNWFNQEQKIFTKQSRRIIKIKNKFGLLGIALLAPVLLSIPLGTFLGERFFKDKNKVILYHCASVLFWFLVLYILMKFFYLQLKGILF
ncbi:MAG: hypothetical protein KatS3mg035_2178 [Bacteroidia bacterium]|nr:MAG: hypothetical protein KatS3mg035_2178 [Bacteroidia bacterium]